ncbi:putative murein peptide carboxypeptidase [Clostridium acetireducens DSM 10703]|jgi:muramoyltetrapeptide carboxypeptidase|uniref:Putative murein peptide carboxypeptidase n=1 Tax=Clostridium acetireducens DSM 10703 TaxID=1121290 RepID=A0A1E8EX02_9CLOT|nr:LD-carboxypeptidase [Clostridium acetireducens]OFI01523.1 putative murein peptide carboxypeptidase [Clostridium acetireducens DSM 10703]
MLPKKLRFGDTIGIVSPASCEEPIIIKKSINYIESLGFYVKEGVHIYDKYGYLAGKDKDRANDIMNMFQDDSITMILCTRGGYGSMRILPYINFEIIKNNPKIFAGFSDITVLLNSIYSKCNLITFHSPMLTSNLKDSYTLNNFLNTIMKRNNPYTLNGKMDFINTGIAEGILVGGNLSLICSTLGTNYSIDTKNKILFIEEVGEEPYKIDRMLTQLLLSGKLQKCNGFILGQFNKCSLSNYSRSLTLQQVIKDRLLFLNKPTVINFMSGHSYPNLTLPIGSKIKINCNTNKIKVLNSVVK